MHIASLLNSFIQIATNPSSFSLVGLQSQNDFWHNVVTWLTSFFYAIFKWILYVVDVIFTYIQQLAGLNMDFSSLDGVLSEDSDIVFNLLINSRDVITPIVRGLIVIAVVLIIFFAIVMIIKNSLQSLREGGSKDYLSIIKSTAKAFVLLLITPMIAIVGIIASNALLKSLYNATNTTGATSLSSQIFMASSTAANNYRTYARNGKRIPIVYSFGVANEIDSNFDNSHPTPEYIQYLKDTKNPIYATYLMFIMEDFMSYDDIEALDTDNSVGGEGNQNFESEIKKQYYNFFDISDSDEEVSSSLSKYRRIENRQEEYYVMADVVDFAVKSVTPIYFKTIEQVLTSIGDSGLTLREKESIFRRIVSNSSMVFLDSSNNEIPDMTLSQYMNRDWSAISYVSNYLTGNLEDDPDIESQIKYVHLKGAKDERDGAKFIVAKEVQNTGADGVVSTHYEPLYVNEHGNYDSLFTSDHIKSNQIIAAKGIFDNAKYPTAIAIDAQGDVRFYRDELENSYSGVTSDLVNINYNSSGGWLSRIFQGIRSVFDPSSVVPNLNLDANAVAQTYSQHMKTVNTLSGGRFHTSYMFADHFVTSLLRTRFVLSIENVYNPSQINYVLLIMGAMVLIKICLTSFFTLINRAFDLFLVIVFYPAACATIPLNDEGYKSWVKTYMSRLFATYGLVLGINFVLMLFPIIGAIKFFDPSAIEGNIVVRRLGALFFNAFSVSAVTNMMNFVVCIIFELVAFTILKTIPEVIANIAEAEQNKNDPLENFMTALIKVGKVASWPLKITGGVFKAGFKGGQLLFSPKKRKELKATVGRKIADNMPFSAVVTDAKDKVYKHKARKEKNNAKRELRNALRNQTTTPEELQKKMNAAIKAQQKYNNAIKDPRGQRTAEKDKINEEKRMGTHSRYNGDDQAVGLDVGLGMDIESLSDNQLKRNSRRLRSRTNKYIKNLKRKQKKEGLTSEEASMLHKYENLRKESKEELERRKTQRENYDLAKKQFKDGKISKEEFEKIKQGVYEQNNKNKSFKKSRQNIIADHKEQEKREKQRKDDIELFKKVDEGGAQKKRLRELEEERKDLANSSELSSLGMNIAGMDSDQLGDLLNSTANLTEAQRSTIEAIRSLDSYKKSLLNVNATEFAAKAQRDTAQQNEKNAKYAGYRGPSIRKRRIRNSITKGTSNTAGMQKELDAVNAKLDAMKDDVSSENMDEYRELMMRKTDLTSQLGVSSTWKDTNNAKGRYDYKNREKMSGEEKRIRASAIRYLEREEEPITEEAVQRYVDNVMRSRSSKGKKRKK